MVSWEIQYPNFTFKLTYLDFWRGYIKLDPYAAHLTH